MVWKTYIIGLSSLNIGYLALHQINFVSYCILILLMIFNLWWIGYMYEVNVKGRVPKEQILSSLNHIIFYTTIFTFYLLGILISFILVALGLTFFKFTVVNAIIGYCIIGIIFISLLITGTFIIPVYINNDNTSMIQTLKRGWTRQYRLRLIKLYSGALLGTIITIGIALPYFIALIPKKTMKYYEESD